MRVLELDLDFYLDHIAHCEDKDSRLSDTDYRPWTEDEVRRYLEEQCRLSINRPVKRRFVTHHHGAFSSTAVHPYILLDMTGEAVDP